MKKRISIHIGQYHASREPAVIHTVLGSCVSVCLFDAQKRVGGMNHILLPGKADLKQYDWPARYGINAMELLINRIFELGGSKLRLTAKVFGGAHVIPAISSKNGMGNKNAAFALQFLKKEGIQVLNQDIGGSDSRKIFFHTDTGDVFLKRISPVLQVRLAREETAKFKQLRNAGSSTGQVVLFNE